jgi:DNA-binding response OmpR family regulator
LSGASDLAPADPSRPHGILVSAPNPVSVLVIEDSMDVADSIARFLRVGAGFDVRVAYNGEAGLKAAHADPPKVVVCDLSMPRLNGLRVAEELSRMVPRPLLIAVTAFAGAYPEDLALLAGFDHYLVKPADPFAIEAIIRNHSRVAGPTNDLG